MTKRIFLFLPIIPYLLALNPYLTPSTYDNIVYFEGARSIVESFTYSIDGIHIIGWPFGLSGLLAIPFSLGFDQVMIAKGLILCTALFSWQLIYQLLKEEKRPFPLLSTILFALSPFALQSGSRILSEYPFTLLSMLFLLLLSRIGNKNSIKWTVGAAITLFGVILLRPIGIALMIPIFVAIWQKRQWTLHYLSVLCIGLTAFFVWKGYTIWVEQTVVPLGKNYIQLDSFLHFEPHLVLRELGNYLLELHLIFSQGNTWGYLFSILVLCVAIIGYFQTPKCAQRRGTDAYILCTLCILSIAHWKLSRYLLPIAPFLFSYILGGIGRFMSDRSVTKLAAIWSVGYLCFNGALLTIGNGHTYGGLSVLASPTPEHFYKGYWGDLYQASRWIKRQELSGDIALLGKPKGDQKYVFTWSQTHISPLSRQSRFIVTDQDETPSKRFHLSKTFGTVKVFTTSN